jgi:hypothetical protein
MSCTALQQAVFSHIPRLVVVIGGNAVVESIATAAQPWQPSRLGEEFTTAKSLSQNKADFREYWGGSPMEGKFPNNPRK